MSLDRLGENLKFNFFTQKPSVKNNSFSNPFVKTENEIATDTFSLSSAVSNPILEQNNIPNNVSNLYSPTQLLKAYTNTNFVEQLMEENPKVIKLLEDKGIEPAVYPENISKISNSHITTTTAYALDIANQMNLSNSEKQLLEQACVFHDFGKILIPSEIVNKPGSLDSKEKSVMDLHTELGYELLSATGMNKRVLNMVKNHHNPTAENSDKLGQILSVADIYSALREDRSYKTSLSEQEAFKLLDQKAENGEVSTEVVNALKASVVSKAA